MLDFVTISEQYAKDIQEQLKYSATWFPNVSMSLGDVGIFRNHQFYNQGNLEDFGIKFEVSPGIAKADYNYSSKDSVSIQVKLAGEAPVIGSSFAQADAGVTIKFNRENAVLFRATGCKSSRIKNLKAVGNEIRSKQKVHNWGSELVVVGEVITAEGSSIIISHGKNSQVDLSAKGKLTIGNINLADMNIDFSVIYESNIATCIVAEPNLTPLFRTWTHRRAMHNLFRQDFGPVFFLHVRV